MLRQIFKFIHSPFPTARSQAFRFAKKGIIFNKSPQFLYFKTVFYFRTQMKGLELKKSLEKLEEAHKNNGWGQKYKNQHQKIQQDLRKRTDDPQQLLLFQFAHLQKMKMALGQKNSIFVQKFYQCAQALIKLGYNKRGREKLTQCLQICKKHPQVVQNIPKLNSIELYIAESYFEQSQFDKSKQWLQKFSKKYGEVDKFNKLTNYDKWNYNLQHGAVLLQKSMLKQAIKYYQSAGNFIRQGKIQKPINRYLEIGTFLDLGRLLYLDGDKKKGLKTLSEGFGRLKPETDSLDFQLIIEFTQYYIQLQLPNQAYSILQRCMKILQQKGQASVQNQAYVGILLTLMNYSSSFGDYQSLQKYLEQLINLAIQGNMDNKRQFQLTQCYLSLAMVKFQLKNKQEGLQCLRKSLQAAKSIVQIPQNYNVQAQYSKSVHLIQNFLKKYNENGEQQKLMKQILSQIDTILKNSIYSKDIKQSLSQMYEQMKSKPKSQ